MDLVSVDVDRTVGQPTVPAEPGRRRTVLLVVGLPALLCVVLRLAYVLLVAADGLDGDEAVAGIMAQRIAQGESFVFFLGQDYLGSVEPYLQALALSLAGNGYAALRLVPTLITGLVCALVSLTALAMWGDYKRATTAGLLYASGPFFAYWLGVRAYTSYTAAQLIGVLALYAAVTLERRVVTAPAGQLSPYVLAATLGFCCGAGLWATSTTAFLLVPAALYASAVLVRHRRLLVAALLGATVGLTPLLAWTVDHGRVPQLFGGAPQPPSTWVERMSLLLGPVLRGYLGLSGFGDVAVAPPAITFLLLTLALVVLIVSLSRRRRGLFAVLTLRYRGRQPSDVLLLVVLLVPLLYAASPYTWFAGVPRYLAPTYPAYPLLLVAALPGRRRGQVAAALVAASALLTTVAMLQFAQEDLGRVREKDMQALRAGLLERNQTRAYAEFEVALPLEFLDGPDGALQVSPRLRGVERLPRTTAAVDASNDFVYIVRRSVPIDQELVRALQYANVSYTTWQVGDLLVLQDLSRPVRPDFLLVP